MSELLWDPAGCQLVLVILAHLQKEFPELFLPESSFFSLTKAVIYILDLPQPSSLRYVPELLALLRRFETMRQSLGFVARQVEHWIQYYDSQKVPGDLFVEYLKSEAVRAAIKHIIRQQAHHRYFYIQLVLAFSRLVRGSFFNSVSFLWPVYKAYTLSLHHIGMSSPPGAPQDLLSWVWGSRNPSNLPRLHKTRIPGCNCCWERVCNFC